ncbi:MAG TPA: DUF4396 domain-containing protein [Acidobacteriaceae bacterium]|nr:DUF4396 domain-containing protein [Acidobacteriaceae bacterium]
MAPYSQWLHVLAWASIAICLACALGLTIHTLLRPQKMAIMGVVWPITALYLGPLAVALYRRALPVSENKPMSPAMKAAMERHRDDPPTLFQNTLAVFHCGAGCSLGDLIAESIVPALGITFAGKFGSKLVLDFAFAYILGIAFQYFTIVSMRGLSFGKGLLAAARADTISIALFEVGMFAWMAITYYLLFPSPHLDPGMAVFWFMMQIAMIAGTLTALPANAWLIRKGWKEKMPPVDPSQMQKPGPAQNSGSRIAA